MIAIKNMEMPSCCNECPMYQSEDSDYCDITGAWITGVEMERHSNCPLVEITTCNDCKYWNKDSRPRVPDNKEYHFCPMMDCNTAEDDFFCKDGKRRE